MIVSVQYGNSCLHLFPQGLLLRLPIWDQPKADQVFDDHDYWELPEEGVPHSDVTEIAIIRPTTNDAANTKV